MKKICFFAKVDKSALDIVNFYKQDIDILKDLGYDVKIATKWSEIDWSCNTIFIWWWTWAFIPVFISKIKKKKTIITGTFNFRCPHSNFDYFRRSWIQKLLIKYSVKNANRNIFVSEIEMNQIVEYWNLKNSSYSPHIVETNKYYPISNIKRKGNDLLSICWSQKTNMDRKCVYEMIDVIEAIISENIDVTYYIAGRKGDGFDDLVSYINNKGLNEKIVLLGEISEEEKIRLMRKCGIYFQISKFEGFGLAIAEAMACGMPVISSYVGEVPNVIGDAGILCSNYDIGEIKEQVMTLLNNPDLREDLSEKATKKIETNFNYNRRFNDIKEIIKNIEDETNNTRP